MHRKLCLLPCRTINAKTGPPLGNIDVRWCMYCRMFYSRSRLMSQEMRQPRLEMVYVFPTLGMIVLVALRHTYKDASDRLAQKI